MGHVSRWEERLESWNLQDLHQQALHLSLARDVSRNSL